MLLLLIPGVTIYLIVCPGTDVILSHSLMSTASQGPKPCPVSAWRFFFAFPFCNWDVSDLLPCIGLSSANVMIWEGKLMYIPVVIWSPELSWVSVQHFTKFQVCVLIYSLSSFQICNIILLTVVTVLGPMYPESLYLLTTEDTCLQYHYPNSDHLSPASSTCPSHPSLLLLATGALSKAQIRSVYSFLLKWGGFCGLLFSLKV